MVAVAAVPDEVAPAVAVAVAVSAAEVDARWMVVAVAVVGAAAASHVHTTENRIDIGLVNISRTGQLSTSVRRIDGIYLENSIEETGAALAFILVLMSAVEGTYFWKAEFVDGLMSAEEDDDPEEEAALAPNSSSCIWLAADWKGSYSAEWS